MNDTDIVTELLTQHPSAGPTSDDLADRIVEESKARKKRRLVTLAVAAVVMLVGVGVPVAIRSSNSDQQQSAAGPVAGPIYGVNTRGSLAKDTRFLAGMSQHTWNSSFVSKYSVPTASTRKVVFAGDVPGARVALIVSTDRNGLPVAAWFVGPKGAAVGQMIARAVYQQGFDPAMPAGVRIAATGALVVVSAVGDTVAVAGPVQIAGDGTPSFPFTNQPAVDGVAVVDLGTADTWADRRVRVTRNGDVIAESPVLTIETTITSPAPAPFDNLRGLTARYSHTVDTLTAELANLTGLPADQLTYHLLWVGDIPAPDSSDPQQPTEAAVVAATVPYGATIALTGWSRPETAATTPESTWTSSYCGLTTRPPGRLPVDLTLAFRCDVTNPAGDSTVKSTLLVVASPSATTARLINGTGSTIAEVPLTNGETLIADPGQVAKVDARVGDHISLGTGNVNQSDQDISLVPPSSAGRIN